MNILGINAYHGDAAAVLLEGGKLLFAAEEERFNRIKHSAGLPRKAVEEILKQAGPNSERIDYLTLSRDPTAQFWPKLKFVLKNRPPLRFLKERVSVLLGSGKILDNPESLFRRNGRFQAEGIRVEHHLAHAASAFYPSGFDRAALLTIDGFGDFSSVMFGIGEGNKIRVLKRIIFPHSLGILYSAVTQFLGFSRYGDEYKVMGLGAYGETRFVKQLRELIELEPEGGFRLNLDYFTHPHGKVDMTWSEGEPLLGKAYSPKWEKLFGPARNPQDPISPRDKDLAASAQSIFEETFFHLLRFLYEETRLETLSLAGGCAFNSVANGKIFDKTPFRKVYIQPAAGDAGTALGSALYTAHHRLNLPRGFTMDHVYWGPEFGEAEISKALSAQREVLRKKSCEIEKIEDGEELCRRGARAIAGGKIVGWFQGRMEWGPRALGNRSILADPRPAEIKDVLNERVKYREGFRPFAPSVLEEKAGEWFDMKTSSSPFMNFVFPVRTGKKETIPAVTHVDGTARMQTVSRATNPLFWNLIHEFERISGVPMVLNTSFNENEPIVCTPEDALECFLRTRMDVLVLGSTWIKRKRD